MAEGDTHFEVSATLRLKKTKFEKDARRAAKSITPLERSMKRTAAGSILAQHQISQLVRKQKLSERAAASAERASRQAEMAGIRLAARRRKDMERLARESRKAEMAATRLAEKRSRELARTAKQARRAEIAIARLKRKSIGKGLGTAKGMMAPRGMAGPAGMGRVAGQGAMIGAGAATLGLGAVLVHGLRFNKMMEDMKNSVATMFQMFDVGKAYLAPGATGVEIFRTNVGLAREAVDELLVRQAETPAGFTQVAQVFGQGIAGLAKGTKDVDRMLSLVTQISKLGPSLNNDYAQLGRDTMRILSGSAEQEVQVWRLLKSEFFLIAKGMKGMLPKGMKDGEDFVKFFNKSLSAAQRMELFEKAMSKLGPEFEKMFRESMSGLLAATSSKLSMMAGALAGPLYESFKTFLGRVNLDTLLAGGMTQRWMGIAGYFGQVLGDSATKLFLAFERGAMFVDAHWNEITDNIILAFKIGGIIIQAYIAKAIAGLLMAPAMMAGGAALGAGKGMLGFLSKVSRRREKMGGRGLMGSMGSMAELTKYLRLVGLMAGPAVIAFIAVGAALAVMGFAAAAIAIYITKNWDKLVGSIIARWNEIGPSVEKLYLQFDYLMGVMSDIGGALLGGGAGADMFITLLEFLEEALYAAAKGIVAMLKVLSFFNQHAQATADQEAEDARRERQNAQMSFNAQAKRHSGSEDDEWELARRADRLRKANAEFHKASGAASEVATRGARLVEIEKNISLGVSPADKEGRERAKAARLAVLRKLKSSTREGRESKAPKGGVHITNQYNQWDLRNTDPDRIMSAFLPKLESLADQRNQSYEQTEQGI